MQRAAVPAAGEHRGLPVRREERRLALHRGVVAARPGRPSRPTARAAPGPARSAPPGGLPGGHALGVGREAGQRAGPAVGQPPRGQPVDSAARSGLAAAQAANASSHSACACLPRSATWRACATASSSAGKVTSGSKPRIRLVAATSSAPSAAPCASPVFCAFGAGQAMMVRSAMRDGCVVSPGREVGLVAAPRVLEVAVRRAPVHPLHVPAVRLVPGRTSSDLAILVSPSIEMWLSS